MVKQTVPVWGFPPESLVNWPDDLKAEPVESWTANAPVLVHFSAAEAFVRVLTEAPELPWPFPILWVHDREQLLPEPARDFFLETVPEGDWAMLRTLTRCPHMLRAIGLAESIPPAALGALNTPAGSISCVALPLPAADREHLAACPSCRSAFDRALDARLWLRRRLTCPPMPDLAAFAAGRPNPEIDAHLRTCQSCQALTSTLGHLKPRTAIMSAPLLASYPQSEKGPALPDALLRTLASLISGAKSIWCDGAVAVRGVGHPGALAPEMVAAIDKVMQGKDLTLVRSGHRLRLTLDRPGERLRIERLETVSLRQVRMYSLELELCDGSVRSWSSDSDGCLAIPLPELSEALEIGVDELVVRSQEERSHEI